MGKFMQIVKKLHKFGETFGSFIYLFYIRITKQQNTQHKTFKHYEKRATSNK